jgi:hypothetical protein
MQIVLGLPVVGFSNRVVNLGIRKKGLEFLRQLGCYQILWEINTVLS